MQDISLCDSKTQHYKQKRYDIRNRCSKCQPPLPSARQHPSYGDCLEVKREYYQNCSMLRPLSRAAVRFPAGAKLFRRRRNSAPARKCAHKDPNKVNNF